MRRAPGEQHQQPAAGRAGAARSDSRRRVASSAHCASSTRSTPGPTPAVAATSASHTAGEEPLCGARSGIARGGAVAHRCRAVGHRRRCRRGERVEHRPAPGRSRRRSSSITGAYARPDSSSYARPTSATPPPAAAARANSSASRVLPMPASPSTSTTPSVRAAPVEPRSSRGQLGVATDERRRPSGAATGTGRARPAGGRGGASRCRADRLVQRGRLPQRRHAELAGQRPDALAVLRQRPGPVAGARQQPDQRPVRGLVQRVEREPPADDAHAPARSPAASRSAASPARTAPARAAAVAPRPRPSPRTPGRPARRSPRGGRRRYRPRGLLETAGARAAEPSTSTTSPGPDQPDVVTGGLDVRRADGRAQGGQRAPQRAAGVVEVLVGPEQIGERRRAGGGVGSARWASSGHRLAGVERDGRAVALDARRTEQPDLDHCPPRHGRSPAAAGRHDGLP